MTSAAHPQPDDGRSAATLPDVLDRILDKGLVVAGDITIQLLDIEIVTVKVRLLLASAERAEEMGIDWWKHDPFLSGQAQQDRHLDRRVERLEELLEAVASRSSDEPAGQAGPSQESDRNRQQEASSHGGENQRDDER